MKKHPYEELHDAVRQLGREIAAALRLEKIVKWLADRLCRMGYHALMDVTYHGKGALKNKTYQCQNCFTLIAKQKP